MNGEIPKDTGLSDLVSRSVHRHKGHYSHGPRFGRDVSEKENSANDSLAAARLRNETRGSTVGFVLVFHPQRKSHTGNTSRDDAGSLPTRYSISDGKLPRPKAVQNSGSLTG